MDRCALFVDAGYALADGAMAVHGTHRRESVSWDHGGLLKLLASLARDRTGLPVLRCYWYEVTPETGRTAEHDMLAEIPGLKLRLVNTRPGRREGIEAPFRRDLVTLAKNGAISDAIIVSSDESLAELVTEVQDLGIRVVILHIAADGGWTIPPSLRQECDDIVEITGVHLRPLVELIRGAEPSGHSQRYLPGPTGQPVAALPAPGPAYQAPTPGDYLFSSQNGPYGSPDSANRPSSANADSAVRRSSDPLGLDSAGSGGGPTPTTSAAPGRAGDGSAGYGHGDYGSAPDGAHSVGAHSARSANPETYGPADGGSSAHGSRAAALPHTSMPVNQSAMHDPLGFAPGGAPGASQGPDPRAAHSSHGDIAPGGFSVGGATSGPNGTGTAGHAPGAAPGGSHAATRRPSSGFPAEAESQANGRQSGSYPASHSGGPAFGAPGANGSTSNGPLGAYPDADFPGPGGVQRGHMPLRGSANGAGSGVYAVEPGGFGPNGMGANGGGPTGSAGAGANGPNHGAANGATGFYADGASQAGGQGWAQFTPPDAPPAARGGATDTSRAGYDVGGSGLHSPTGADPGYLPGQPGGSRVDQRDSYAPGQGNGGHATPGSYAPGHGAPGSMTPGMEMQPTPAGEAGATVERTPPRPEAVQLSLPEAVQAAHGEGFRFGDLVGRDAPALWLDAVLARKPRMPSDLEARLLQGSALPIDSLLHDEVRHSLRRGFWDALENARR